MRRGWRIRPISQASHRPSMSALRGSSLGPERVRERVAEANSKLATLTEDTIERVYQALQAEQVAESNRIEGYDWTASAVEDVVARSDVILNAPLRDFLSRRSKRPTFV